MLAQIFLAPSLELAGPTLRELEDPIMGKGATGVPVIGLNSGAG